MVSGGLRWSPMVSVVSGGLRWSPLVSGGLLCSPVVSGGLRWSPWISVVSGGLRWSPVFSGGLRWSPWVSVVAVGLQWSPLVSGGLQWSLMTLAMLCTSTNAPTHTHTHTHACTHTHTHAHTHTHTRTHTHTHTHTSAAKFLRQSGSRGKSLKEQLVPRGRPRSLRNSSLYYSTLPSHLAMPKNFKHYTWPSTMTCLGQQWTQRGQTASTLLPMAGELTCCWQTTRPQVLWGPLSPPG